MTQRERTRPDETGAAGAGGGRAGRNRERAANWRLVASAATLAALSACAGQAPTIPATQEAADYRSHARNWYQPPGPAWDPWGPYVKEASNRFDVPETWIRAVMHQESGGQEFAVSVPGAMGLMQIMPFTYDLMREQYDLGDDPYDPHNNILAGVAYIRQMYDIYGSPGFLAAYNAGPGRLDDFLTRNRPLPAETRHYVASIGPEIAFDSPHSRSDADLMAMNHERGQYGPGSRAPVDPTLARSVELAWARRGRGDEERDAEVAEAAPVASASTTSGGDAARVRAAWARRDGGAAPAAVRLAAATPTYTPAPTPGTDDAAPPAAPSVDPVRLADARIVSPPGPELADSVAEAPDTPAPFRRTRFRLVNEAVADTVPFRADNAGRRAPIGGGWAIQVGAFGSAAAAHEAAGSVARSENHLLGHARAEIAPLHDRRGRIYRARLTGLSRDAAMRACDHLGRRGCIVVSPEGA